MLEIFTKIIGILTTDATLNAIVPATSIFTGAVDVTMEKQVELLYPRIVLWQVSEISRTVPQNARDTQVQLDIWSRNSMIEVENIYERVLTLLNYDSGNKDTAHVFWQRLSGAVDQFETDRRIWHRSITFTCWSMKP